MSASREVALALHLEMIINPLKHTCTRRLLQTEQSRWLACCLWEAGVAAGVDLCCLVGLEVLQHAPVPPMLGLHRSPPAVAPNMSARPTGKVVLATRTGTAALDHRRNVCDRQAAGRGVAVAKLTRGDISRCTSRHQAAVQELAQGTQLLPALQSPPPACSTTPLLRAETCLQCQKRHTERCKYDLAQPNTLNRSLAHALADLRRSSPAATGGTLSCIHTATPHLQYAAVPLI